MRVAKAGVVGAGTMGSAIAELLAYNGIEVVLKDVDSSTVEKGLGKVRGIVDDLVRFQETRAPKELQPGLPPPAGSARLSFPRPRKSSRRLPSRGNG